MTAANPSMDAAVGGGGGGRGDGGADTQSLSSAATLPLDELKSKALPVAQSYDRVLAHSRVDSARGGAASSAGITSAASLSTYESTSAAMPTAAPQT